MDDFDRNYQEEETPRKGTEGFVFDLARKAVATSVKSLLSTEEGLRALIGAIVPKEIGVYVSRELAQLRADVLNAGMAEFSKYMDKLDIGKEVQKAMDGMTFDVSLKVSISHKDGTQAEAEKDGEKSADTEKKTPRRKKS